MCAIRFRAEKTASLRVLTFARNTRNRTCFLLDDPSSLTPTVCALRTVFARYRHAEPPLDEEGTPSRLSVEEITFDGDWTSVMFSLNLAENDDSVSGSSREA